MMTLWYIVGAIVLIVVIAKLLKSGKGSSGMPTSMPPSQPMN